MPDPKKDLACYLALPYTIQITQDQDESWFIRIRELEGCMTQVDTWDDVRPAIREIMELWIGLALERGRPIPDRRDSQHVRASPPAPATPPRTPRAAPAETPPAPSAP